MASGTTTPVASRTFAATGTDLTGLGVAAFALFAGLLLVDFRRFALRR